MPAEKNADAAGMERFNVALRQIMQVKKETLKRLLASDEAKDAVKQKRGPRRGRA